MKAKSYLTGIAIVLAAIVIMGVFGGLVKTEASVKKSRPMLTLVAEEGTYKNVKGKKLVYRCEFTDVMYYAWEGYWGGGLVKMEYADGSNVTYTEWLAWYEGE